jgi:Endoglucanase
MKQYFSIAILIFACHICAASNKPVNRHGQLHIEGASIVDQRGLIVALKGVSLGWHNWWPQYYNSSVVEHLSHSWDISVIRTAMGVEPEGGYLENPENAVESIKAVVDAAIANGIYVIVNWHSHDIYSEQSEVFFSTIAQQYAGYPNIIYEIFNEPNDSLKWEEIKSYSIKIIDAIRKYDDNNLIIVGTPNWSQGVDIAANDPIKGYNNIAYSLHFYAASHDYVMYKAVYARRMGIPLFVSECSPSFANGDGVLDKKKFSRWLGFMKRNKISFVMWGLYDKDESTAMLKDKANFDGNWPSSQLTEMGIYSRQILKEGLSMDNIVSIISVSFIISLIIILIRKKIKK